MVFTSPVTKQYRMTQGEVSVKEGLWFVGNFKVVLQREEWKVNGPVPAPAAVAVGAWRWQEEAALSLARISYFASPACAAMLNMFLSVNSHFLPFFFKRGTYPEVYVIHISFLPASLPCREGFLSWTPPVFQMEWNYSQEAHEFGIISILGFVRKHLFGCQCLRVQKCMLDLLNKAVLCIVWFLKFTWTLSRSRLL